MTETRPVPVGIRFGAGVCLTSQQLVSEMGVNLNSGSVNTAVY